MKEVTLEVGQHGTWGASGRWGGTLVALGGKNGLHAIRDDDDNGNLLLDSRFVPDGARLLMVTEDGDAWRLTLSAVSEDEGA